MVKRIVKISTVLFLISLFGKVAYSQISEDKAFYTVQDGETLLDIAEKLGDEAFWRDIYSANSSLLSDTGGLEAGQVLKLPPAVTESDQFIYAVSSKSDSTTSDQLKEFRKIFNKLVKKDKEDVQKQPEPSRDPSLQLGGFVLDETISKMGRDFYNLFYQHWTEPEGASNYTLTISEQPSIGRGTQITIKLDYDKIFTARLQPRYEYIDALSQQAVVRSQRIVKQQASIQQQLMGY